MGLIDLMWWSVAAACWLGGAALLGWALFRDRSRGRRRCPRCWYDLEGLSGRRCPECGREAKSERQLLRTRRRWKWAFAGVFVVALGFVSLAAREVQRHGWVDATPTFAYIILLPHLDDTTTFNALRRRVNNGELRQWEYRLLVRRAIGVLRDLEHEPEVLIRTARLLARIEIGRNMKNDKPWGSWAAASEIDLDGCLEALVGLLDHNDVSVRIGALASLRAFNSKADIALPMILGQLASDDSRLTLAATHAVGLRNYSTGYDVRAAMGNSLVRLSKVDRDILAAFGNCRMNAACACEVAEGALSKPCHETRALAVYVLTLLGGDNPCAHDLILQMADYRYEPIRTLVVMATAAMPLDDRVEQLLRRALRQNPDTMTTLFALDAVARRGTEGAIFLSDVSAIITSAQDYGRLYAARCFISIGGDPLAAVEALLERIDLRWPFPWEIDVLGEMKADSPQACAALEPLLSDRDPETRSAAAVAYARLGGADLDAATRAVFESLANAAPQYGLITTRWLWHAADGRFSHDVLRSLLQSEDPAERANAVRFLGEAGAAAAPLLPEMRGLLDDPDPRVQQWAPNAVRRVEFLSR